MIINQVAPSVGNIPNSSNAAYSKVRVASNATVEPYSFVQLGLVKGSASYLNDNSLGFNGYIKLSDSEWVCTDVSDSNGKLLMRKLTWDDETCTVTATPMYTGPNKSSTYNGGFNVFCNGKYFVHAYGYSGAYVVVVDIETGTALSSSTLISTANSRIDEFIKYDDTSFIVGASNSSTTVKRKYTIADDGTLTYSTTSSTYTSMGSYAQHAPSTSNANRYINVAPITSWDGDQETNYISGATLQIGTWGRQASAYTICSGLASSSSSGNIKWAIDDDSTESNLIIWTYIKAGSYTRRYKTVVNASDSVTSNTYDSTYPYIYGGNGLFFNKSSTTILIFDKEASTILANYCTDTFEKFYGLAILKTISPSIYRGVQDGYIGYYSRVATPVTEFTDDVSDTNYGFALSGGSNGEIVDACIFNVSE